MMRGIFAAAFGAAMALAGVAAAQDAKISGSAFYRERMALPPNARFEAVIVDASRADASAPVFARTVVDGPIQPPIRFEIAYDPKAANPAARYSLRATISVDGKLWFTTDRFTPVITQGDAGHVELLLRRVGGRADGPGAPQASPMLTSGEFRYMADAATFEFCRSGLRVPVAMEGAYKELETAYSARRSEPGAPLFVTVEGAMSMKAGMEGAPRRTLTVSRFVAAWPGETCERNKANARLTETYWKIATLKGAAVQAAENTREPNIVFHGGGRFAATAGCNRITGGYEAKGRSIRIGPAASTMMACPPQLAERERALTQALAAVRSYAIAGSALVLYDEARAPVVVAQAVALR